MWRTLCKSKIHRATVTDANLSYEGSVTIDSTLMEAADITPYERVQIVNLHNGARVETYVIAGDADSGVICMNGAAARWAEIGDQVIIISYAMCEEVEQEQWVPRIVHVDADNHIRIGT